MDFNLSLEIFPPKKAAQIATVYDTIHELVKLEPDFISVTYGAGGSIRNNKTVELASLIKNKYHINALAHLTCINSVKEDIETILCDLKAHGIRKILALRGDKTEDFKNDFKYAYELIPFIKERGDFKIYAACYPEYHPEAESPEKDICHLKEKIALGASEVITQLFLDNTYLYSFLEKAKLDVPVHAGIMPVLSAASILRMSTMCGAKIPAEMQEILNKYENDSESLKKAGIDYAVNQIIDLVKNGVKNIHIYAMNNSAVAKEIYQRVKEA